MTDVEKLVQQWLAQSALAATSLTRTDGGVNVFRAMPNKAPLPSIVLSRVGGAPPARVTLPQDNARISFACWAASRDEAAGLAAQLVDELGALGETGGWGPTVTGHLSAAEVLSLVWVPDPASDTPRYVVDAIVTAITG